MTTSLDHEAGQAYTEQKQEEKKTQAQILIELTEDMKLFHDEQDTAYAKVRIKNHYEVWQLRSHKFRLILIERYMNYTKGKVAGNQAISDALNALEAKALIYGEKEKVYLRVAETDDSIYLDLCNQEWRAIHITASGWKVVDNPPVNFKRSRTMQPLPTPIKDGSIDDLKGLINYGTEENFKLIVAWLLSTFKERSPFPILNIQGEQGSAKSTTTKMLRSLVDNSSLPLRALPNNEQDLAIGANNTWILAFDNLSGFPASVSDSLCKMSTGGGLATRKLYSDDDEAVFNIMRPVILNGIDDIAKRQDLLDRSIIIELPSIEEENRTDVKAIQKKFNDKKAGILGALCTVVSHALKELPNTKLEEKPRMADFALWITASEKFLGWEQGDFMEIYTDNREHAIDQGLESDPFASAVMQLLESENTFIGTATQLIEEAEKYTDERTINSKAWVTSRSVRNRLKRINPAFKKKGIIYNDWHNKMKKTLKLDYIGIPQDEQESDIKKLSDGSGLI